MFVTVSYTGGPNADEKFRAIAETWMFEFNLISDIKITSGEPHVMEKYVSIPYYQQLIIYMKGGNSWGGYFFHWSMRWVQEKIFVRNIETPKLILGKIGPVHLKDVLKSFPNKLV